MFDMPLKHEDNKLAYWMLMAVHALTAPLVPLLSPEDAAGLSSLYTQAYPKSVRLPAQKKVAALLKAQSGEPEKRTLLDKLRRRKNSI
jgi:hypothetical protein